MENSTGNISLVSNKTTEASSLAQGLYSTLLIVIMFFILIGNTLVLLVLYRQRRQKNLRVTNVFLANLAVVDLWIGILMFPFSIATVLEGAWLFGDAVCQMNGFTNMTGGACSILTMAIISFDRYRAIVSGPGHKLKMNHALVLLAVIWVWGSLIGILPILGWNEYVFAYGSVCKMSFDKDPGYILFAAITCFALPFLIMFFCYLKIFLKVRSHRKLISRWRRASVESSKETRHLRSETRTAKIVFTVLFVFSAAWTPFVIVHLLQSSPSITLSANLISFVTLFAAMHSFCNPIIYITMNRKFRADMYEMIPVLRKCGRCCGICYCCCCRQRLTNRVNSFTQDITSSSGVVHKSPLTEPNVAIKLHALAEDADIAAEREEPGANVNPCVIPEVVVKEEKERNELV